MTNITKTCLFLIMMAFSLSPAFAAKHTPDAAHGKSLHKQKCMSCHDNGQYTRSNRIIHSFEDLRARVKFCDSAANAGFSNNDLDDVVEYLNNDFYKFKK